MYSEQARRTTARVLFRVVDPSAKPETISTSIDESDLARMEQTINNNRTINDLFLSTKLFNDGFVIAPTENEIENEDAEVAYVSDSMSDIDGYFTANPVVEFDIGILINTLGFTMNFSDYNYPETIKISAYNGSNLLLDETLTITDSNTLWDVDLNSYNKIRVEFIKLYNPYSRAQLVEVDFGKVETFENKEIISLALDETMNLSNQTIEQNQLSLKIEDVDKKFNILNPTGIYSYLLQKQPFTLEFGVETIKDVFEYTEMGRFFLKEWTVSENVVDFTTRDIFYLSENTDWIPETCSDLYEFAESLMTQGSIVNYNIDNSLIGMTFVTPTEGISILKGLEYLGVASGTVVYEDRASVTQVQEIGVALQAGISADDMYSFPKVNLKEEALGVTIKCANGDYTNGTSPIIVDCPIINAVDAPAIAIHLLDILNLRLKYDIDWRQNPLIEVGKLSQIDNEFGEEKIAVISEQRFSFNGALSGQTKAGGSV